MAMPMYANVAGLLAFLFFINGVATVAMPMCVTCRCGTEIDTALKTDPMFGWARQGFITKAGLVINQGDSRSLGPMHPQV